jgi:hypothetical protein
MPPNLRSRRDCGPGMEMFLVDEFGGRWKSRIGKSPDSDGDHLGFALWFPVDCRAAISAKVEGHFESAIG